MNRRTFAFFISLAAWSVLAIAAERVDRFGVVMLHPTLAGGREWFAAWDARRTVPEHSADPLDPLFRNEEGVLRIENGIAVVTAGQTRLKVMTSRDVEGEFVSPWRNVEMTVYARRGTTTKNPSYQAFDLAARSGERHNDDAPCDGTSYHATARFDGQFGFKKEIWHTGGYTELRPEPARKPWPTVPEGKWIGLKLVCRNFDADAHVRLELYLDRDETNDWQRIVQFDDAGGWRGEQPGCNRPQDAILTGAYPVVYFRTDYVNTEVKKFSVREIAPLP